MSPLASRASTRDFLEVGEAGPGAKFGLLGNPENRRLRDFARAVSDAGWPPVVELSYQALLDGAALDPSVELWRLDSPGENAVLARRLIALGGGPAAAPLEFGEIGFGAAYHRGFCRLLERLPAVRWMNDPAEVALMFDKWLCHERFVEAGLPRPESFLAPPSFEELRCGLAPSGRLFLKPLHGSSASGVCALRWTGGRCQMLAPLQIEGGRPFNSLKVRSYSTWDQVAGILEPLLAQGMVVERWIPKLGLGDGVVDLRVLVIAGQARHRVVRQSSSPMTNLHLGNRRGCEDELREALGEARWSAALRLAERAAACFPRCLYAGVDILLDRSGRAYVGEINAFGDLLPGLVDRGESAYAAVARAAMSDVRSCAV